MCAKMATLKLEPSIGREHRIGSIRRPGAQIDSKSSVRLRLLVKVDQKTIMLRKYYQASPINRFPALQAAIFSILYS
jgi:hypothetical protein